MFPVLEWVIKGGPVMVPLVGLSVFTVATGLERAWFWFQLMRQEQQIVSDVLYAAREDLDEAGRSPLTPRTRPLVVFS